MKAKISVLLITLIVVLFFQCKKEPTIVSIPDDNFLNALIKLGVDKDGDGIINFDEAAEVHFLNVTFYKISDMKGIEAFVNLDSLFCYCNYISSLDVSKNTSLKTLKCWETGLKSLNVSK